MMNRTLRISVALAASITCSMNAERAMAQQCEQIMKLVAEDGDPGGRFGRSLAINGNIALIGSWSDENGSSAGPVYVFDLEAREQLSRILPEEITRTDRFGSGLTIHRDTAVIGAKFDSTPEGVRSGTVYLFDVSDPREPNQIAWIYPDDGEDYDRFGGPCVTGGEILLVSAPGHNGFVGAVYVYDFASHTQLSKITPSDGYEWDGFGGPIEFYGEYVFIGASSHNARREESGAVYVFDLSDPYNPAEVAKFFPPDGQAEDHFGSSIALSGETAAILAFGDDDNGRDAGSVYVYDISDPLNPIPVRKLYTNDPDKWDDLTRVRMEGSTVVVSNPYDSDGVAGAGAVFVFDAITGKQVAKLTAKDAAIGDRLGWTIEMSERRVFAGAEFDDAAIGSDVGSVYVFDLDNCACLGLFVHNLVAGEPAWIGVNHGTPGARGVTVYGLQPGLTEIDDVAGYCATFGIDGVNPSRIIGGFNQVFDERGEIILTPFIPAGTSGINVLFQTAEQGTCPDECVSNVVEATIQ